jgi:hypothetical protein
MDGISGALELKGRYRSAKHRYLVFSQAFLTRTQAGAISAWERKRRRVRHERGFEQGICMVIGMLVGISAVPGLAAAEVKKE